MAYDLQEQEQIDAFKAWWNRWGNLILIAAILVLGSVAGYQYYQRHQLKVAAEANALFQLFVADADKGDAAKAKELADRLVKEHPKSAYAQGAMMFLARVQANVKDFKAAKASLEWVANHAPDVEYQTLAKLRIGTIMLEEKSYDEALKWLQPPSNPHFSAIFADRRGDVLLAQGKSAEARAAFNEAYKAMTDKDPMKPLVKIKLDSLGGES